MNEFERWLKEQLEPILASADPREKLSAYHDMPYALFRYDPAEEFELRKEVRLLATRPDSKVQARVTHISLSECSWEALQSLEPLEGWYEAERANGTDDVIHTISNVLTDISPLVDRVAERMPQEPQPLNDIALITRAGALFPVYRTFSLLEQIKVSVVRPPPFAPGRDHRV